MSPRGRWASSANGKPASPKRSFPKHLHEQAGGNEPKRQGRKKKIKAPRRRAEFHTASEPRQSSGKRRVYWLNLNRCFEPSSSPEAQNSYISKEPRVPLYNTPQTPKGRVLINMNIETPMGRKTLIVREVIFAVASAFEWIHELIARELRKAYRFASRFF